MRVSNEQIQHYIAEMKAGTTGDPGRCQVEDLYLDLAEARAAAEELRKDAERWAAILFAYGEANEATQHPYWLVLRNGVLRACDAVLAGPFFSREAATNHMMSRRYEYGDKAYVYCFSGHWSRQYKELREAIAAQRQKEGTK